MLRVALLCGPVGALALSGCIPGIRTAADAVRAQARLHGGDVVAQKLVIPFEVPDRYVDRVRDAVRFKATNRMRAKALIRALSEKRHLGVVYEEWRTLSADEALRKKRGNCFSFASILVGLGRAMGLKTVYADFSSDVEEVQRWGDLSVRTGHITALVWLAEGEYISLEIGLPTRFGRWRVISDAEATAHYYNNRAFERLVEAERAGRPPPWADAERDLRIATALVPSFYRAWNNLGVVMAQLGQPDRAIKNYREAIAHAPKSVSARANLGRLYLDIGRPDDAAAALQRAAEVDGADARVQYLLGVARWRSGRAQPAVEALQRALQLDAEHASARSLLAVISRTTPPDRASSRRRHRRGKKPWMPRQPKPWMPR